MAFPSSLFLLYFLPMLLLLYYTIGKLGRSIQHLLLVLFTLLFYLWANLPSALLLVCVCILCYLFGLGIASSKQSQNKTKLFYLSLGGIALLLFVFRYLNVLQAEISSLFQVPEWIPEIVVPMGISIYMLHVLSYLIDVYHERIEVQKNPIELMVYLSFFPAVRAGVILEYASFSEQWKQKGASLAMFSQGLCRFIQGLAVYCLLGVSFALIADRVFALTQIGHTLYPIPITLAWLGLIALGLQLYFQLSAYSSMGIGIAQMLGYSLPENFHEPYAAKSLTAFWKRWMMSFIHWVETYIALPLEHVQTDTKDQLIKRLFLVWLFISVWSGAGYMFLAWGMLNFLFLCLEKFLHFDQKETANFWRHIWTLAIVLFGFLLLRSEHLSFFLEYGKNLLGLNHNGVFSDLAWMFLKENIVWFLVGIWLCFPASLRNSLWKKYRWTNAFSYLYPLGMALLLGLSLLFILHHPSLAMI